MIKEPLYSVLLKVGGLKAIYITNAFNSPRNEGGAFAQKTYITFNKGANWRLLKSPENTHDDCQHEHVSYIKASKFDQGPVLINFV